MTASFLPAQEFLEVFATLRAELADDPIITDQPDSAREWLVEVIPPSSRQPTTDTHRLPQSARLPCTRRVCLSLSVSARCITLHGTSHRWRGQGVPFNSSPAPVNSTIASQAYAPVLHGRTSLRRKARPVRPAPEFMAPQASQTLNPDPGRCCRCWTTTCQVAS